MITIYLKNNKKDITQASNIINGGGVVAFPTETVYGIGANIFNEQAINSIFSIKGRSFNKPLSAHISDIEMVKVVCDIIPDMFYELAKIFLPGPLTMILQAKSTIFPIITANTRTIAIRFPANQTCKNFIDTVGVPLAATSANISGKIAAVNADEVKQELDSKIHAVIDDGQCEIKKESTVISLLGKPTVIRIGAITVHEIEGKLGRKFVYET